MKIYECKIEAMESIFFVSREFGKEYISLGLIGNTALPYALNFVKVSKVQSDAPRHREDFKILNEKGIFVTPVSFIDVNFETDYYCAKPDRKSPIVWQREDSKGNIKEDGSGRRVNMPDEGWIRLIKRGSWGYFYMVFQNENEIPEYVQEEKTFYIRVGKFMSKCKVEPKSVSFNEMSIPLVASNILRLQDIPTENKVEPNSVINIANDQYMVGGLVHGTNFKVNAAIENVIIPKGMSFYGGM